MTDRISLPIRDTFAGRHVLVTGCSGFLGKVWLAMALERLPEIGRLYVLIRRKANCSARQRLQEMLNSSPVFGPLHERFGAQLSELLSQRVECVEGDVSLPNLGADLAVATRLQRDLDLVINFAGLVDFNPDLREALSINVHGTLHTADFVQSCQHAALVHVSTCYVCGCVSGRIPEQIHTDRTPNGRPFNASAELIRASRIAARIGAEQSSPEARQALEKQVREHMLEAGQDLNDSELVQKLLRKQARRNLKAAMAAEGTRLANDLGWPNAYTYTKSMAEALLAQRKDQLRFTIFRPATVESALDYPVRGWNEGFNTTAPVFYLAGGWLRQVPARGNHVFDFIPVDMVANATTLCAAALLRGCQAPVYHCGSSGENPVSIERTCDLAALAWRQYLRQNGRSFVEREIRSRFDIITAEPSLLRSPGLWREVVHQASHMLYRSAHYCPDWLRRYPRLLGHKAEALEGNLARMERVFQLYRPFCYDNNPIFETQNLAALLPVEPEFAFDPKRINWREYLMQVHLPGLQRFCFPAFEGLEPETLQPASPVYLAPPPQAERASQVEPVAQAQDSAL